MAQPSVLCIANLGRRAVFRDHNPQMMACAALNLPARVAIRCRIARRVVTRMAGLRHFLISDSIQLFLGEQMIVAVKDGGDLMLDEQLMNRQFPARTMLFEAIRAISIASAPFIKPRCCNTAACAAINAADQMMQEDEFEFGFAACERFTQPLILLVAERPRPVIVILAIFGKPKGIKHDEERIAPFPRVIILQQSNEWLLFGIA